MRVSPPQKDQGQYQAYAIAGFAILIVLRVLLRRRQAICNEKSAIFALFLFLTSALANGYYPDSANAFFADGNIDIA